MSMHIDETLDNPILSVISKLFSLEVQQGPSLIGPVFVLEETGIPGENLRCLVESNWKHSSHMRPRWNFNLITALSRNRTACVLMSNLSSSSSSA